MITALFGHRGERFSRAGVLSNSECPPYIRLGVVYEVLAGPIEIGPLEFNGANWAYVVKISAKDKAPWLWVRSRMSNLPRHFSIQQIKDHSTWFKIVPQ